jgi:hypothetical protein
MVTKIFKVIWFFSLLATSGVLLYVYASLPEVVSLVDGVNPASIQREYFFYGVLILLAVFNLFVFILRKLYPIADEWNVVAWFYGLAVFLNLFLLVSLSFTSLINSGEKFDYPRIGVIIYGSVFLLAAWSISWPISLVFRRIRS